jgi:lincosamide nucleotidyltransferase A/C/D/E
MPQKSSIISGSEIKQITTTAENVIDLYLQLEKLDIYVWIDGGWSVDAVVGRQLRTHEDLDIAIQRKDVPQLRETLSSRGYLQIREESQWNFVLGDGKGHEIDVHVFVYDDKGNVIDGIMYPVESLTGKGMRRSIRKRRRTNAVIRIAFCLKAVSADTRTICCR